MSSITIVLPHPPKALHPNARPHYMAKANAKAAYRRTAMLHALPTFRKAPKWKRATIRITWYSKINRRPDPDNCLASMKAGIDGIKDAGVLDDDRDVRYEPIEFGVDKLNPRVVVVVIGDAT